ncbi:MAG: aldehyde dehydrogenase (NADP(+)) [Janthinobacterium lividum]
MSVGTQTAPDQTGFRGLDPRTGQSIGPNLPVDDAASVTAAVERAEAAFETYRSTSPDVRARFLETIASSLEARREAIIASASAESGLPTPRITGEFGRTTGQLKLFAGVVRQGDWLGVRLDPALPDRAPLPRPDLRVRRIPVGPVAVFGASNFPLAFSVAGGDTASALAAGCTVVVRGHPAHPGTSALVGEAIDEAVRLSDLPVGVFSLVSGPDIALGQTLVSDPRIASVGFTGSRNGGLALARLAAERPVPIPVFAEMSSINPVFLCPAALEAGADALADGFIASLTLGAGQFCTNPGVVIAIKGAPLDAFVARAGKAIEAATSSTMLTAGIHAAYDRAVDARNSVADVTCVASGQVGEGENQCRAALFHTTATRFNAEPSLTDEVFGASGLIIACDDADAVLDLVRRLEGQLTATLHMVPADEAFAKSLLPLLERRCGRILVNGWPTGVEVAHAMVHGGPFPSTTDGRFTSVGTLAIDRFLRPVCYQNLPQALLPPELADTNPLGLNRRIDGVLQLA